MSWEKWVLLAIFLLLTTGFITGDSEDHIKIGSLLLIVGMGALVIYS